MLFFSSVCRSVAGRVIASMLALLLVLLPLASCSTPQALQFTSVKPDIPTNAMNSPVVGTLPDSTMLHLRITFKLNQNWLKSAEQQKIQPGQPSHLENLAKKIGIDDATYQKVKDFFNLQGLALNLSKLRTHLAIDGKAGTFAKLLQTKFVVHQYNGRTFYAPDAQKPPQLPKFLTDSIDALTGLDNYSSPPQHDFTMRFNTPPVASTQQHTAQDCSPLDQTLLPREVAGAYGYDQLWQQGLNGENMTVNLVEIDGFYRADVQNYLDCIQFKGHLSVHNIDGAPQESLGEATLDVQMAAGLARSINLAVYQTNGNTDGDIWAQVNDELQQILNDNTSNANSGSVVSISLGSAEHEMTMDDMRALDSSFQQLTRVEHMTVFVASGDCGAFTSRQYGQLSVSFPASDPWVTSVGGTILSVDSNRQRVDEVVWSDGSQHSQCKNQWGSGGGNSDVFKMSGWQNAPGVSNRYSRGARELPDVSAVAYALAVFFKGQWGAVGGTSAAAPIWAAGVALTNEGLMQQVHKFGYAPQLFYQVANQSNGGQPYFDVTRGNNLYYPATPGWDFATGLGTPNLPDFYQAAQRAIM